VASRATVTTAPAWAMETPERSDPLDEKFDPPDPAGVTPALAAALGVGERAAPTTLQLKAVGVFVSVRGRDLIDIITALDALPAQLARLDTRREERRLVYAEGAWRIDP